MDKSFYTSQFTHNEAEDLRAGRQEDGAQPPDLLDEIDLLRVAMRRTLELSSSSDSLHENIQVLRALAAAAGELASLARAYSQGKTKRAADKAEVYRQALEKLRLELEARRGLRAATLQSQEQGAEQPVTDTEGAT
jgi:hypothetical protein